MSRSYQWRRVGSRHTWWMMNVSVQCRQLMQAVCCFVHDSELAMTCDHQFYRANISVRHSAQLMTIPNTSHKSRNRHIRMTDDIRTLLKINSTVSSNNISICKGEKWSQYWLNLAECSPTYSSSRTTSAILMKMSRTITILSQQCVQVCSFLTKNSGRLYLPPRNGK